MKKYFFNPKSRDLVIYDTEEKSLDICEEIKSVRVWLGGEVRLGDFGGSNPDDTPDRFDDKPYTNHNYSGSKRRLVKKDKPKRTRVAISDEQRAKALEMSAAGESTAAVAAFLGTSYGTAWKLLKDAKVGASVSTEE